MCICIVDLLPAPLTMPTQQMKNAQIENLNILNALRFSNGDKLTRTNPLDLGDWRLYDHKGTFCIMTKAPGENLFAGEYFKNYKIMFKLET